ncbi:MAG: NAD(P)H-binding protein [Myxococcales bacterium]|nr:NAD(P)H-binding protein [Myxococcales bacterium]
MTSAPRPRVAVTGASGFVGSHLLPALATEFQVVALGRHPRPATEHVEWRTCDLFSASSTRAALEGIDVAIYLVHSMMPSSRLFQGSFHDTDLLLADNFARACVTHGVKQIIYLGGLVPDVGYVSPHLQSRQEVEAVLQATGIPVTCLRAGMVVGPGGSSFEILHALVQRLPWMVLPRWTKSLGQAIFIDDVVTVLKAAVQAPAFIGKTLDLVNGEALTYEDLLRKTAAVLGKRRLMLPVPIASTGFSKRWVQLFSGASHELISPLIDSLQCDLPQPQPMEPIASLIRYRRFEDMLVETVKRAKPKAPMGTRASAAPERSVRSIQRLPPLPERDARFISNAYMAWLPRFFRAIIRVKQVPGSSRVMFSLLGVPWPLLVLELINEASDADRDKFHIVGGLLSKTTTTGWLEFRQVSHRRHTLAAIHGFEPALPWLVYRLSQAPVHALVMSFFGRFLARTNPPALVAKTTATQTGTTNQV